MDPFRQSSTTIFLRSDHGTRKLGVCSFSLCQWQLEVSRKHSSFSSELELQSTQPHVSCRINTQRSWNSAGVRRPAPTTDGPEMYLSRFPWSSSLICSGHKILCCYNHQRSFFRFSEGLIHWPCSCHPLDQNRTAATDWSVMSLVWKCRFPDTLACHSAPQLGRFYPNRPQPL